MAVVAAVLGLAAYSGDWLERLELGSVDARFSIRGAEAPPDDVVVVAIDDATLAGLTSQPRGPRLEGFPRGLHARVIERLHELGARPIAYDVRFTGEQESALLGALEAAQPTVLATTGGVGPLGSEAVLRPTGARAGSTVLPTDTDGRIRRLAYSIRGLPSFPVAAAELAARRRVNPDAFDDGDAWIDFHGPPGTIPTISFARVLSGHSLRASIRGKIVVVGATAPSLGDTFETSAGGGRMSGAEIQANAISTIRRGLPLRDAPAFDVFLILVLAAVPALAAGWLGPFRTLFIAVFAGALFAVGVQLAFQAGDRVLALTYPLAALALSTAGALLVRRRPLAPVGLEPPAGEPIHAAAPTEPLPAAPPAAAPVAPPSQAEPPPEAEVDTDESDALEPEAEEEPRQSEEPETEQSEEPETEPEAPPPHP